MEESRIEIVKYPKVKHVKIFVNKINYVEDHIHNDFEVFVVLHGSGSLKINSVEYVCREGDIFLINSGEVHSFSSYVEGNEEYSDGFTSLFFQISNHFAKEYFSKVRTTVFESVNLRTLLSEENYTQLLSILLHAAIDYFSEPDYFQLQIVSQISQVMTILLKNVKNEVINEAKKVRIQKHQRRLERIISYIDDNFDTKIKLEDIAKRENLSITHLSHIFSASFGMTFQEFVNVKRMEQCIRLMSNKEKTLLEIAYESGFSDSKYMNKMFIKKFGCTPKEYRRKYSVYAEDFEIKTGKLEMIYNDSAALKKVECYEKKQSNYLS